MNRQEWFYGKRWGLFSHYLSNPAGQPIDRVVSAGEWNAKVNRFDVKGLAKQVKVVGADYVCITIGQNSGNFCSPNKIYDRLTGISPSRCSSRDLVAELSDALSVYGIDLLVYLPSGAPNADSQAVERLEWENGIWEKPGEKNSCKRLAGFQRKWESVIREWSLRWGEKVKGWWIDGCYFSEDMYEHPDEPNFKSFAAALRAGNENAVLTFNKGLEEPFMMPCEEADFTAGEVDTSLPLAISGDGTREGMEEKLNGKKLHVLSFLGSAWGEGTPRFPNELAAGYTKYIVERDGIVTWDIRLQDDGLIPECFMEQLMVIGKNVKP